MGATGQRQAGAADKPRTGRLMFYHPNSKGTGTALQLELRLNRGAEDRYDCFFLEMAQQKSTARRRTDAPWRRLTGRPR